MKAYKGFALMTGLLIVIGVLVIGGGVTYALVPRAVLKDFFQTGDKPTEAQFADTIDSALNLEDDGNSTDTKVHNPTKEYQVGDTAVKSDTIYQTKILTEANAEFKLDADIPVTFRWTPQGNSVEPVTYRIKVWQLMQGQNGTQAKANEPVVTKDVDTATEVTVNGLYTGPCKPPYLCDFVWNVEVMSKADSAGSTSGAR
jgi:hypothetical protein